MSRLQPVLGTEIVDDIRLGHTWHEYEVLKDFVLEEEPDLFIEIGVHEGGLSYLLIPEIMNTHNPTLYLGIEWDCSIIRPPVIEVYERFKLNKLMCADCFSDEVADEISKWLGKKIFYCDGGNKALELKHFWTMCNENDIIMAHDFHDGIRKVKGVPEPHPEVLPTDILHLSVNESFERLPEDIFKETRIIGFRKIK
jgi:hypothetical protein